MKIFTLAAALAARTLSPTQTIYCEEGTIGDRQRPDSRHAHQRVAHADADPGHFFEHRCGEDRDGAR